MTFQYSNILLYPPGSRHFSHMAILQCTMRYLYDVRTTYATSVICQTYSFIHSAPQYKQFNQRPGQQGENHRKQENVSSINNNAGVFHRIVCPQIRKTREYYYAFNGANSRL